MAKVAFVGDSTSVAGFRPLGFAAFPTGSPAEARELWPRLSSGEFDVVFVTEPVYEVIADLVFETMDRPVPAVTVIPGVGSPGGVGQEKLDRAIVRALGTTLQVREEED